MAIDPSFFGPFVGADPISIFTGAPQLAPAPSGGGETFGGLAGARSAQNFEASYEKRGSCMEELLRAMQYREIIGVTDGASQLVVDSPQVPTNSYWFVMAASLTRLPGGNTSGIFGGLFLMAPTLAGSAGPETGNGIHNSRGVQVDVPNPISFGSLSGGANSILTGRGIVVPPGWFLRFANDGSSTAPAAGARVVMCLAFAELPLSFDALELL
jgi:hypothetical protein